MYLTYVECECTIVWVAWPCDSIHISTSHRPRQNQIYVSIHICPIPRHVHILESAAYTTTHTENNQKSSGMRESFRCLCNADILPPVYRAHFAKTPLKLAFSSFVHRPLHFWHRRSPVDIIATATMPFPAHFTRAIRVYLCSVLDSLEISQTIYKCIRMKTWCYGVQ